MSNNKHLNSKKILITDPVSASTRLIKRNLLFFSAITVLGITYGPGSITVPMTNLPSDSLLGAIGCVVLYHIISYSISFATDVQGWHMAYRNTLNEKQLNALSHLSERMAEIDNEFRRLHSHLSSHKRVYKEQSDKRTNKIVEYLKTSKGDVNLDLLLEKLQGHNEFGGIFNDENSEIMKSLWGGYQLEVENVSSILTYFQSDAKKYRKLEKLIKRELLQLRVIQYFQVYVWSLLLPLMIAIFAVKLDFHLIMAFINSILK